MPTLVLGVSSSSRAVPFANRVQIDAGASLMLSGGLLAQSLRARSGASVAIIGSDFALDGAPITGLTPGQPYLVTQTNATLSGVLSDGSPFAVALAPQLDRGGGPLGIDPNAVLTVTLVPEPRAAASVLTAVLGACLMSRPRFRRSAGFPRVALVGVFAYQCRRSDGRFGAIRWGPLLRLRRSGSRGRQLGVDSSRTCPRRAEGMGISLDTTP